MINPLRSLLIATVLALAFAAPAAASPKWLSAVDLSSAPTSGGPSDPQVASDDAGETFAAWIRNDGLNNRVQIAAHVPGAPWGVAVDLSEGNQDAASPSLALSSNGFGALAWSRSDGANRRIQVARRAPGGGFGVATTVSAPSIASINPVVAVDTAGDVVVIWEDASLLALHARRFSAIAGAWGAIEDLASAPPNQGIGSLALVLSASGTATAAWSFDTDSATSATQWQVQTRSQASGGGWTPVEVLSSTSGADQSAGTQLAIDAGGNVTAVWSDYRVGCPGGGSCVEYVAAVVKQSTRSGVNGAWSPVATLSDPTLVSDGPRVATTPAGEVTVAWTEQLAQAIKIVTRPVGGEFPPAASATQILPQDKIIASSGAHDFPQTSLRVAAGASGTVVSFARYEDGTNALAEAVYKPAGTEWPPASTPPVILSPPGVNVGTADGPNLAMDGQGNAVLAWTGGAVIKAAALDAAGPTFTAVNVPASGTTGQSVPLSASTHDVWSPLGAGQPSWTFGDGTTGAGAAVTHVFARAGTYTVSVGASDSLSNASAPVLRQIVIADGAGPRQQPGPLPKAPGTSVAKPKVTASYKGRKLTGSVELTGTSPLKTTLTITIRKRSAQTDATSIDLAAQAGAWTTTIKLPSNLSPGIYNVFVSGRAIANASTSFTIDAPRWGYLKRAYATGPKRGPAATRLVQTSELWAHFKFANLPKKGQRITTKWTLPNGKKLAANTRPRKSLVEAQVKGLSGKNLPVGRWRCVLRVGGIVVGTLTVRLK